MVDNNNYQQQRVPFLGQDSCVQDICFHLCNTNRKRQKLSFTGIHCESLRSNITYQIFVSKHADVQTITLCFHQLIAVSVFSCPLNPAASQIVLLYWWLFMCKNSWCCILEIRFNFGPFQQKLFNKTFILLNVLCFAANICKVSKIATDLLLVWYERVTYLVHILTISCLRLKNRM